MNDVMRAGRYAVTLAILHLPVWFSVLLVAVRGAAITVRSNPAPVLDNFTVTPSMELVLFKRGDPNQNQVTLSCRNASHTLNLASTNFWLLYTTPTVSLPQDLAMVGINYSNPNPEMAIISFTLHPEIEGHYFCGDVPAMEQSINYLPLLAYPTPNESYVNCYSASVDESIVLPCPFSRGLLHEYYTFFWVHNFSTIYSGDSSFTRPGFAVNSVDFSLTIESITPSHEGAYRCQVEVDNPLGNPFYSPDSAIRLVIQNKNSTSRECPISSSVSPATQVYVTPQPLTVLESSQPMQTHHMTISSQLDNTSVKTRESSFRGIPVIRIACAALITSTLVVFFVIIPFSIYMYKWRKRHKPRNVVLHTNTAQEVENGNVDFELRSRSVQLSEGSGQQESTLRATTPDVHQSSTHIAQLTAPSIALRTSSSDTTLVPSTEDEQGNSLVVGPSQVSNIPGAGSCTSVVSGSGASQQRQQNNGLEAMASPSHTPNTPEVPSRTSVFSGSDVSQRISALNNERSVPTDLVIRPVKGRQAMPSGTSTGQLNSGPCLSSGTWTSPTQRLSGLMMSPLSYDRSCPGQSAETLNFLRTIDDYQDQSINFVFLGSTQVLVCDSKGGKYEVPEQGILIRIPPKALDEEANVEVGVVIHGSFKFPDYRQPISAMVWLTVRDKAVDFVFKKPVEIHLPHFLNLSRRDIETGGENELGLGFLTTDEQMDHREQLILTEGPRDQVVYQQRYAKIKTNHFCFFCLSAKESVVAERSLYLLTQVLPPPVNSLQWDVHFYISYNLDSFKKMIKDQHPKHVMKSTDFEFVPSEGSERLKIVVDYKPSSRGWRIAFQNYQQVKRSGIHSIWENDVSDLQAKLKLKAYPPRISATVSGEAAFENITAVVSFEGSRDEGNLSREIHFMLPREYVDNFQERLQFLRSQSQPNPETARNDLQLVRRSPSAPYDTTAVADEPSNREMVEVMKLILAKFRSWKILMTTLSIPEDKSEAILQEENSVKVQILRMLNTWKDLHRHDGTCTRAILAALLRQTDTSLVPAARILEGPPKDHYLQHTKTTTQ